MVPATMAQRRCSGLRPWAHASVVLVVGVLFVVLLMVGLVSLKWLGITAKVQDLDCVATGPD